MINKTESYLIREALLQSKVKLLTNPRKGDNVVTTSITSECSTTITSFIN